MKENWIDVKLQLPEEGLEVLVYAPDFHLIGPVLIGVYIGEQWTVYDFHDSCLNANVTHWQPIETPG